MQIKANADAAKMQTIPAKRCKCRQILGILWKTQILTESEFAAFWKLSALPSGK